MSGMRAALHNNRENFVWTSVWPRISRSGAGWHMFELHLF
jgi:hypothetical protein